MQLFKENVQDVTLVVYVHGAKCKGSMHIEISVHCDGNSIIFKAIQH